MKLLAKRLTTLLLVLAIPFIAVAQQKTITGKVTSEKGGPVSGASVVAKGSNKGTKTATDGTYSLSVPSTTTSVVISSVNFESQTVAVDGANTADAVLKASKEDLSEVVVVGYGTARKKDLTGALTSLKEKEFNKGLITSPDQLIQGKAAGVQIISASGAPNAGISVRIRGNSAIRAGNDPLYVVDGVQLSGSTARPGSNVDGDLGGLPGGNPLSFINPSDIASIDILKDASATAIYGSRGSNGVVIITTKRGQSGAPKLEFTTSFGTSKISKKIKYASASEYRAGLAKYGLTSGDLGANTDALDAILQRGGSKNYSLGMSGGNDAARYRLSLGYVNQKGIVLKTDLEKYNADFNGQFKFLESKKLAVDVHLTANQNQESVAPISNNGGFRGSLIGQALQWNPTRNLFKANGDLDIDNGGDNINPLGASRAYDDFINVNTVIASVSPSYKITNDLEYKLLVSFNQSKGNRKQQIRSFINFDGYQGSGWGRQANAELLTTQITHTLNYNKSISSKLNIGALAGYEFVKIESKGNDQSAKDMSALSIPYYEGLAFSSQGTRRISSYFDPTSELQSYFIQGNANLSDKYLFRATFRADGSNKFGANNKIGYFPSVSAAWNVDKENFMKNNNIFSNLKLRLGWGLTGNQDFPAGSSITRYTPSGPGAYEQQAFNNPDLKWQTDAQSNIGVDFGILKGRVNVTVDYFNKSTKDLIVQQDAAIPSPGTKIWRNIAGNIQNSGLEFTVNSTIIKKEDFTWNLGFNSTFQKNKVDGLSGPLLTGGINGQGLSGAFVQRMTNGQPLNVFYVRKYNGIKADGQADLEDDGASFFFMGSGLPKTLLGITSSIGYEKISFDFALNGAFGHKIYNNTENAVLPINNLGNRNVSPRLLSGPQESTSSPITTSSRYLEKGDFLRLSNATLNYSVGALGKVLKNANIFLTGQNLFVITKFTGFDPEVNVDKNIDGVPSFGIEYTPYPAARTFIFGVNFSL
jgi:TonB-dependent starch-binding outer membrane protein SusC